MGLNQQNPNIWKAYSIRMKRRIHSKNTCNSDLPAFLHNKAKGFIQHCRRRMGNSENFQVQQLENGRVTVSGNNTSNVIDPTGDSPHCPCDDGRKYHLPCCHVLAVITQHGWSILPPKYRDSELVNLDCTTDQDMSEIVFSPPKITPTKSTSTCSFRSSPKCMLL